MWYREGTIGGLIDLQIGLPAQALQFGLRQDTLTQEILAEPFDRIPLCVRGPFFLAVDTATRRPKASANMPG